MTLQLSVALDRIAFKFPVFPFALRPYQASEFPIARLLPPQTVSPSHSCRPPTPASSQTQTRNSIYFTRMSFLARRTVVAAPRAARAFSTTPSRPLAKITIVGGLVQTPELQATSTGREVLKYAIASNVGRGENTKTSYFRVTSFEAEGPRRDYFQTLPKGSVPPPPLPWSRKQCCDGDLLIIFPLAEPLSTSRATRPTTSTRMLRARPAPH